MAGTWIKMLTTLHDSHKVRRLSRLVGCDRFGVVGRLHRIWSWADEHTIDGRFIGDIKDIDDIAEFDGFARAMIEIGWLAQIGDEITLIDFEKHNGETAKKRAQGAKSASRRRGNARVAQKSRTERDASVTKSAPREEKRREESKKENAARSCSDDEASPRPTQAEKRASPVQWDSESGFAVCAFRRAQWARAYPGVDIGHELDKAHAWYTDNPRKRKSDLAKFLGGWISRAHERIRSGTSPPTSRINDQYAMTSGNPDDSPLAKLRREAQQREKRA